MITSDRKKAERTALFVLGVCVALSVGIFFLWLFGVDSPTMPNPH